MKKDSGKVRPRLVSSGTAIGAALVGGLGLLIPFYTTANEDLAGARFISAIVLAAGAILLVLEGVQRIRADERGKLLCGLGAGLGLASLLLALLPANSAAGNGGGLRLDLRPTAPDLFTLAFEDELPLPQADEGWGELHRRGGIDVGRSHFRMILANEGPRPVSILSIQAEVLGSQPTPDGTIAHQYSQGDEGIDRFLAFLPNDRKGSVADIYAPGRGTVDRSKLNSKTPFFASTYVLLRPGEVYPAALTIEADTQRTITYRLVAEGESADQRFVVRSRPYRLVGDFEDPYQEQFGRYYTLGHDPSTCTENPQNPWIDARVTRRSLACPYGAGQPYSKRPPSESEYPPGSFQVDLRLARGKQSATISGVEVGGPPAATPVPNVVKPLLRSLGTWTACSVLSPSDGYWTAKWEDWGLELTFPSDGGTTDCTPASPAPVQEIEVRNPEQKVDTEVGSVTIGATSVPKAISHLAEPGEGLEDASAFFVPGSSPCDPSQTDLYRFEIGGELSSGILAWEILDPPGVVTRATTTLAEAGSC